MLYRKLVLATLRNKDIEKRRQFIKNHCRPWRKLYDAYKDSILDDDLSFLIENDIEIATGKSRNAKISLSVVYQHFLEHDDDKLATLEAYLFLLFLHLIDEEDEAEDRATLKEICDQYEIEEDQASQNAIKSIVETVRGSLGNVQGKEPTVENIAPIVQAIIGNQGMQNSMSALAQNLLSGKTDIPSLVQSVKASVEAQQGKGKDEEVPALTDEEDESSEESD